MHRAHKRSFIFFAEDDWRVRFQTDVRAGDNPALIRISIRAISRSSQMRNSPLDVTRGAENAMIRYTSLRRIFEAFAGSSQRSLFTRSDSVSSPIRTGQRQASRRRTENT